MFRFVRAAIVAVLLCSCTMVRYNSPSLSDHQRGHAQSIRSLSYLWGIIPPNRISLEMCGDPGIKSMKVNQGLIDMLITYATAGIVISYKVKVVCSE